MTSRVEAEGNSIDEAIEKGLQMLGVTREQVRVEILQDARRSLLGFGGQKARVQVSLRSAGVEELEPEEREARGNLTEGTPARPPAVTLDSPEQGGNADPAVVLGEILDRMGFPATVEAAEDGPDGQLWLRISTEAGALLIGRHGQTLDALEYLVNRVVGKQEERGGRVLIDCEGYRERRARELREAATRLAEKVRQRGKAQTMEAMNPRDRRIVHLALSGSAGIVTRSIGQGYLRRVIIAPAREARS